MSRLTDWMDNRFYGEYSSNWDDLLLRTTVLQALDARVEMLDLGAGRGNRKELDFRGHCRFVAGVDPDPAVLENPYLDEARLQSPPDFAIPYPDERFDVIVSNNVLEHVTYPAGFFQEVRRVLKPGGLFFSKTPNRHHYVAALARLTPHAFHQWSNRFRGRAARDTFPTVYACNTVRSIRRICHDVGLEVVGIETVEGRPEYLRLTFPTYLLGLAYERLVNSSDLFQGFRCVLLITLRSPA